MEIYSNGSFLNNLFVPFYFHPIRNKDNKKNEIFVIQITRKGKFPYFKKLSVRFYPGEIQFSEFLFRRRNLSQQIVKQIIWNYFDLLLYSS